MSGPQATPGRGANLKSLYGDNCFFADSSWKRMHRSPSDIKVFNFFGGGGCGCGCGCGFGFGWGSFGMGLLGGFLGGLNNIMMMGCNMLLGRLFGGLQFPGMFGGFQMPWGNFYNNSVTNKGDKEKETVTQKETVEVVKDDPDCAKISKIIETYDALKAKENNGNLTETEKADLLAKAKDGKENQDTNNVAEQTKSYENLIKAIEKLRVSGTLHSKGDINHETEPQDINISVIESITDPQDAIDILVKLGNNITEGNNNIKDLHTRQVLLLCQKAGIKVNVAHNNDPSAPEEYIRGNISNVEEHDGALSYKVDNTVIVGDKGLKYIFKATDNTNKSFKLTRIENTSNKDLFIDSGWQDRIYNVEDGVLALQITNNPLVSVRQQHGNSEYISLEKDEVLTND